MEFTSSAWGAEAPSHGAPFSPLSSASFASSGFSDSLSPPRRLTIAEALLEVEDEVDIEAWAAWGIFEPKVEKGCRAFWWAAYEELVAPGEILRDQMRATGRGLVRPLGSLPLRPSPFCNFVCAFEVGLKDHEDFCLVKRILGKGGRNMKSIASEFNSKLRLRGRGSGYREGGHREADIPLQLLVRSERFDDYIGAVGSVRKLLQDLAGHYHRFAQSRGLQLLRPEVQPQELTRIDLGQEFSKQPASKPTLPQTPKVGSKVLQGAERKSRGQPNPAAERRVWRWRKVPPAKLEDRKAADAEKSEEAPARTQLKLEGLLKRLLVT